MVEEACQGKDTATLEVVMEFVGLLTRDQVEGLEGPTIQAGVPYLVARLSQLPMV